MFAIGVIISLIALVMLILRYVLRSGRRDGTELDRLLVDNKSYAWQLVRTSQTHARAQTCRGYRYGCPYRCVRGAWVDSAVRLTSSGMRAGGRADDDVLRKPDTVESRARRRHLVVMQHTNCGLAGVTDDELRRRTGADFEFLSIDDHAGARREDIELLIAKPYLEPLKVICGFVYNVESGDIVDVVRWQRPT